MPFFALAKHFFKLNLGFFEKVAETLVKVIAMRYYNARLAQVSSAVMTKRYCGFFAC